MDSDPVRVGILSYAHVGHAASYTAALQQLDGVEVAAIYDEEPTRGRAYAARFGVPDVYDDVDRLLGRRDIQAVVVCSPTDRHAELVIAAARAGKHVLCEKPIATTLADARAMIDACETAGVQLHVAFPVRFVPMVQKAKQLIDAGEIGSIYGMVGGNRGIPPLPPAYPDWITDPARAGGGALIDHSVHVTDAMRYLIGEEAVRVSAEAGTLFREDLAVDDAAILLLEFADGAVASVDPSWSLPAANPFHYDFYLRVLGSDGLITLDETRQGLQVTRAGQDGRSFTLEAFGPNPDLELVRHFVGCVREGQVLPPAATGLDGLRALEVALAGYEAARRGQPVALRQLGDAD
jgi:predicted dehydrogenase